MTCPVGTIRWGFGTIGDQRGLKEVAGTGIDLSIELGAFAEYWPSDFWRTRLEARNAVYGAEGWFLRPQLGFRLASRC